MGQSMQPNNALFQTAKPEAMAVTQSIMCLAHTKEDPSLILRALIKKSGVMEAWLCGGGSRKIPETLSSQPNISVEPKISVKGPI